MLAWEAARARLEPQRIGDDGAGVRRRVAALPRKAAAVAQLLLGDVYVPEESGALADALSGGQRRALFGALLPSLGDHLERMWVAGVARPYQEGWERRAFRAPSTPAASARRRLDELRWVVTQLVPYEIPGPAWVARWAPHLGYASGPLGLLLAAAIDAGGPDGEEVLEILRDSAEGEEEIGGMGRHVTTALLSCGRVDAWEAVERLLLAAQRQEGLRQVILESADEARPEAFARLLGTIVEHGLVRFSATARAASVWLGFERWAGDERRLQALLERTAVLHGDPAARAAALGGAPEDSYLALVAGGWEDAYEVLPKAIELLGERDPERRFVSAHLLAQLRIPEAAGPLAGVLADDDLRVAARGFAGLSGHQRGPADTFERLERFLARLGDRSVAVEPAVWPGTGHSLERARVAHELLLWGAELPVSRLTGHLDAMDPYGRAAVARRIEETGTGDEGLRSTVIALLGDPSPQVREAAVAAAAKLKLRDNEARAVEALLSRKAGDLRRGAVALLLGRPDAAALESADRLLAEGRAPLRLGGLELLRRLVEDGRATDEARGRARAYSAAHPDPGTEEAAQLGVLLAGAGSGAAATEPATLDDALGLLDASKLTPPAQPRRLDVGFVSQAALEALRSLDAVVSEHRDAEVEFVGFGGEANTQRLGEVQWWPGPVRGEHDAPPPPLPEVWTRWDSERPDATRDGDGLELVRALLAPPPKDDGRSFSLGRGAPVDRAVRRLLTERSVPELEYSTVTLRVLEWLVGRETIPGATAFVLDAAESLLAAAPPEALAEPVAQHGYGHGIGRQPAWFAAGWTRALQLARRMRRLRPGDWSTEDASRLWRLERWAQRPTPATAPERRSLLRRVTQRVRGDGPTEIPKMRPPLPEVTAAFEAGAATEADVFDHLLGSPRDRWDFQDLAELSGRSPRWEARSHEALSETVDRVRRRILEVELARGEAPTAASGAAMELRHSGGLETLVALLQALGKGKLVRGWSRDNVGRETVFSHLIRVTHPGPQDGPATFAQRAGRARIGERRLVELAAFAPQWARHVEAAVERPGLGTAIWWLHAHTKDDNWTVEAEVREAWSAEVAERTRLSAHDLMEGGVDVGWFRSAHEQLAGDGWALVDKAAKFCSSAGGHRRAQLFAAAMLGEASEEELSERVAGKRHQDSVRAIGLLPLPAGSECDAVLLRRYEAIQEFARESRQFGSMRQASEKRAATIGLENLARTAGYEDPTRLGWAMEAHGVADLAEGPVLARAGDVEVALSVDAEGLPEVSVRRGERVLKSVPAAARKHPEVTALRARATELRRRRTRIRGSLEDAMVRGEAFTGAELTQLAAHPLLWPMLERLVLVAEGGLGYPRESGRILAGLDGARLAVGKGEEVRIAHALDLLEADDWPGWQRDCLGRKVSQPFKQVFREVYVPTREERDAREGSHRYAGHQVQPRKALALLGGRGWVSHHEEGLRRTFHAERVTASLWIAGGALTAAEVEPPALELVRFSVLGEWDAVPVADVPPRVFSEVMRDVDLAVSVAHAGGVDPEASASTVEMRGALVTETCRMLDVANVRVEAPRVLIEGELGEYSVHLGSAVVHRRPGGAVCIVPVSGQQRGRLFLPFADDDPRTAEVLAKVLLLARDREIKDPSILEQLRS